MRIRVGSANAEHRLASSWDTSWVIGGNNMLWFGRRGKNKQQPQAKEHDGACSPDHVFPEWVVLCGTGEATYDRDIRLIGVGLIRCKPHGSHLCDVCARLSYDSGTFTIILLGMIKRDVLPS
jgi:hypothetical protein